MKAKSPLVSLKGEPISRRGLIVSAGVAGLAAAAHPYGAFAAGPEMTLKVGFISPRTGKLGGFGETDGYILELARKSLASGLKVGDKTYGGRSRHPVRSLARRSIGEDADQLRPDRHDAGRLDP